MSNKNLFITFIGLLLISTYVCFASPITTSSITRYSYYGKERATKKVTFTIIPEVNDANLISITTPDAVCGYLGRYQLSATGTDTAFSLSIKDDANELYVKTNLSTATFPFSWNLSSTTNPFGIIMAGPLTVEVNNLDPNNVSLLTINIYYTEF